MNEVEVIKEQASKIQDLVLYNLQNISTKLNKEPDILPNNFNIKPNHITLYKLEEISYYKNEKFPRREAFENVISSFHYDDGNLVYIIDGDGEKISFYIGVVEDLEKSQHFNSIYAEDIKKVMESNFRGSKLVEIDSSEERKILDKIKGHNQVGLLKGVPSTSDSKENLDFQGIDRFVNSIQKDKFTIVILMKKHSMDTIKRVENNTFKMYDKIKLTKCNLQIGNSNTLSLSKGSTETTGNSTSINKTQTEGTSITNTKGTSTTTTTSNSTSNTEGKSNTNTQGSSLSKSVAYSESHTSQESTSTTKTRGTSKTNNVGYRSESYNTNYYGDNSRTQEIKPTSGTNESTAGAKGQAESDTNGRTTTDTNGTNRSESISENSSATKTNGISNSDGSNVSESNGTNKSNSHSKGTTINTSFSDSTNKTSQSGQNISYNLEFENRKNVEILKYLDEVVLETIGYSKNKGLYTVQVAIMTTECDNEKYKMKKVGNLLKSLSSGSKSYENYLELYDINEFNDENRKNSLDCIRNLQLIRQSTRGIEYDEEALALYMRAYDNNGIYFTNYYTPREISIIAGIPQKEVVGLKLNEAIDFGLNFDNGNSKEEDLIKLGNLIQSSQVTEHDVNIDKKYFDRHIFIAGVTGSGKTNTCKKILKETNYPFLVIEPAKTEYRSLKNDFEDLIVFTLGDDRVAPFRMNPFEFIKGESLTSRVDMIKGAILTSFDVEAAIPQIIEDVIYESYRKKGWDIDTEEFGYGDPFEEDVDAFPTFIDILNNIDSVVEKHGFDDRLKKDYIGSIKARIKTFTQGVKGQMLCTKHSINFEDLLEKKVVFEIENIRTSEEKTFFMALILININEVLKKRYKEGHRGKHITLLEEAHRLLSKPDSIDKAKKNGVEMFADMLAEVRKYGECLVIVDQIPNKLTPEVLKNTNTKIIHKLLAKDDKETVANTMSFKEGQSDYLSNLNIGRAVVFTVGWDTPVQVQIDEVLTNESEIDDKILRKTALDYYIKNSRKSIDYLEIVEDIEQALKLKKKISGFSKQLFELISKFNPRCSGRMEFAGIRKKIIDEIKMLNSDYKLIIYEIMKYSNMDDKFKKLVTFIFESDEFLDMINLGKNDIKSKLENAGIEEFVINDFFDKYIRE